MKKKPVILEELLIWLRGRFSLTNEEKIWLLLVLFIVWVGLVARYTCLETQTPEKLTPQEIETLMMKDE